MKSGISAILLLSAALAACSKGNGQESVHDAKPRPVLSMVVGAPVLDAPRFVGSIAPRREVDFGFRVLGRMIVRDVDIGDRVRKGDRLAALDPVTLELSLDAAEADLVNAEAELKNADAAEKRHASLLAKDDIAPSVYEQTELALASAKASVARAAAAVAKAREQLAWAEIRAEFDGVVTAVSADVGQTVNAGAAVVTVAGLDERDVVLDLDERLAAGLAADSVFSVATQIAPDAAVTARLREVEPEAEAKTRTRRVRLSIDDPPEAFLLGATVVAALVGGAGDSIDLPAGAIAETDRGAVVWIVDPATHSVSPHPVRVAGRNGAAVSVVGLSPGLRVAVAGANSLTDGQIVTLAETSDHGS